MGILSGRLNASQHLKDKIGSWAFPSMAVLWKKLSEGCFLSHEGAFWKSASFPFHFPHKLSEGTGFRYYFFLSGENCLFNIKLSNCSKKTQANETSAQVWENIHPSPHLIRKMICWIVSHAAHQQTAPSRATAMNNVGERCQQL